MTIPKAVPGENTENVKLAAGAELAGVTAVRSQLGQIALAKITRERDELVAAQPRHHVGAAESRRQHVGRIT